MSKLAKALSVVDTGERVPLPLESVKITEAWTEDRDMDASVYRLGVTLSTRMVVSNTDKELAQERNPLEAATLRAKFMILEEVFGEFRQDLYCLAHQLRNREWDASNRLVEKILHDMYEPF